MKIPPEVRAYADSLKLPDLPLLKDLEVLMSQLRGSFNKGGGGIVSEIGRSTTQEGFRYTYSFRCRASDPVVICYLDLPYEGEITMVFGDEVVPASVESFWGFLRRPQVRAQLTNLRV